jgi:hypothetical protein
LKAEVNVALTFLENFEDWRGYVKA